MSGGINDLITAAKGLALSPDTDKYANDESNTQRDLRILDEWSPDDSESDGSGESTGVDPYNSGSIDTSKSWKSRSRK